MLGGGITACSGARGRYLSDDGRLEANLHRRPDRHGPIGRGAATTTVVGTAWVAFASMAPVIGNVEIDAATADVLDDPLDENFLDRIYQTFGAGIEHPGAAYAVAKLGVRRFVQREAVRLGPLGGRICSVSPGLIDTPQGQQEAKDNPRFADWVQQTPSGRMGRAEEVAAVAEFALSDGASFMNGVDLLVDGGPCAAVRGPR